MGDIQSLEKYVDYFIILNFLFLQCFDIPYFHLLDGFMILQFIVYCRAAYAAMDAEDYCLC